MQCRNFTKKEIMCHVDIGLLLHGPRKSPNYPKSEGNITRESYLLAYQTQFQKIQEKNSQQKSTPETLYQILY